MKQRWRGLAAVAACIILSVPGPTVWAEEHGELAPTSRYEILRSQLSDPDEEFDFAALREAYTEAPSYRPYEPDEYMEVMNEVDGADQSSQYKKAATLCDQAHDLYFHDPRSHLTCAGVFHRLGQTSKADLHQFIGEGLIRAMMNTGDGKSVETAYDLVVMAEKRALIWVAGFEMISTSMRVENGSAFEVVHARDKHSDSKLTIVFRVDRPVRWWSDE